MVQQSRRPFSKAKGNENYRIDFGDGDRGWIRLTWAKYSLDPDAPPESWHVFDGEGDDESSDDEM